MFRGLSLIMNIVVAVLFALGKIEIDKFLIAAMFIELADLYSGVWRLQRKMEKCERLIEKYERKNN